MNALSGTSAFLGIICVFLLIVLLLRFKVNIAYVLLLAAAAVPPIFWMDKFRRAPFQAAGDVLRALVDVRFLVATVNLTGMVLLITTLGNFLKHSGWLQRMIAGLTDMFRDDRMVMAVTPAAIGLLPMPGGAMLSAPMVGEIAKNARMSPERKSAVNYWFRHIWEYCWPLYPGLLFIKIQLNKPLSAIVKVQYPLTIAAILGGLLFILRKIRHAPGDHPRRRSLLKDLGGILGALWPVALVAAFAYRFERGIRLPGGHLVPTMFAGQSLTMLFTLIVMVGGLLLVHKRLNRKRIIAESMTLKLILLVVGMKCLGQMITVCGAARGIQVFFQEQNLPELPVIFILPFIVGAITGYTAAFVSITFPLFSLLLVPDARLAFAFAGGFLGVLLSPVHLCLILTREYFQANLGKIYRLLMLPALTVALVALVILVTGGGL